MIRNSPLLISKLIEKEKKMVEISDSEKRTLKDLEKKARQITWQYKNAKVQLKLRNSLGRKNTSLQAESLNFSQAVEMVISMMDPRLSQFVINEYIERRPDWWYDLYARSTFYRIKHQALSEFISYFI